MPVQVVLSGSGLWTPEHSISNEELIDSYNRFADLFNKQHAEEIAKGEVLEKPHSSVAFVEKASGIKSRFVYCKDGVLDINRMRPLIPERAENDLSHQAEIAIKAAQNALQAAGKKASDIDAVIVACAYTQRAYPAIAIEVQNALGITGFGFDMLVACSAATFGMHRAYEMLMAGSAKAVLVINPELVSPQINYKDRDSHFIFGDVATATVLETDNTCTSEHAYNVLSTKAFTSYSNNIRSNFGYMSYATDQGPYAEEMLFHQEGRRVFKEVCPLAAQHISDHLAQHKLTPDNLKRWWLHQANLNMNLLISKRLLGRDATLQEAPIVLDKYANTASAGSIIAFNLYKNDLIAGDYGLICSFGAGYSIGSLLLQKI